MKITNIKDIAARCCRPLSVVFLTALFVVLTGCASGPDTAGQLPQAQGRVSADKLLPVDCLLPPQVRKLGSQMTYLAARRPIKTTALDCEIRGGEYVAYDRADYRTALQTWLDKAKEGDAEAQTYVGEIYEKGLGLPADYESAFAWYSKAAEQGYSRAQINLGYFYEKGLGTPQDTVKALNWYRRASGVTDDDIDYSSAIEVKAATLAEEKTALLQQEVQRREQEIERLSVSLADTRQQLKSHEQSLRNAREKLQNLKEEMERNKADEARLKGLEEAYLAQQREVERAQTQLATLQSEAAQTQSLVDQQARNVSLQKQQLASREVGGPSIEVFDPTIAITRAGEPTVRIRSGSRAQVISGKVLAPAGLAQVTLNGRPLTTDSAGLFHSAVSLASEDTRVDIQATDQRGQIAQFVFRLIPRQDVVTLDDGRTSIGRMAKSIDFGRYYALVIGNNEYRHFSTLQTAINDARQVADVLKTKYGFETRLITNADRYTILSALNEVKGKMTEKDNLLIYYAGHGERDPATLQGYWLPVDAEPANTANWIPNSAISDLLNTMNARNILVVADSCYSGAMTRSSVARLDTQLSDEHMKKWLKVMAKTKSRTVLTSGGVEPVLDNAGGEHSVFARAFLNELERGVDVIDAYRIYLNVSSEVKSMAASVGFDQTPTYAPIQHTGHSGGEFVFIKG